MAAVGTPPLQGGGVRLPLTDGSVKVFVGVGLPPGRCVKWEQKYFVKLLHAGEGEPDYKAFRKREKRYQEVQTITEMWHLGAGDFEVGDAQLKNGAPRWTRRLLIRLGRQESRGHIRPGASLWRRVR